ncbi:ATP-grasp fold amidoligase family protein [Bacillus sp. FJAT-47783]|uniref:ATP-grasp fold amidoligase family protein n=1 Tax=Bacillus sp. FJAT-47783 TaxID=2922712 RepID=UPI001FABDA36|nr:ATP-grasp fold amidoligase family protein [Bacillus sp. FJAT-47783]
MIQQVKKILKNNDQIANSYYQLKELYYKYLITDTILIKKKFKKKLGRDVNLTNPVKFNDKIQWLKLHWYDPLATKCADKYEVREFVEERAGKELLNELYGVYESVNEIHIDALPESFVLKASHGSGWNIICKNKNEMDWDLEFKKMRRWLNTNFYLYGREWVYRDLKPRIICERFLSDENGEPPKDYKIFCFNGEPKLIQVDFDRFTSHGRNFYDLNWAFQDIEIIYPNNRDVKVPKPACLEQMLELSRKLSKDFPHVRVDFYVVQGRIVFGELTFFHESGYGQFRPEEFETEMGSWLTLPEKSL